MLIASPETTKPGSQPFTALFSGHCLWSAHLSLCISTDSITIITISTIYMLHGMTCTSEKHILNRPGVARAVLLVENKNILNRKELTLGGSVTTKLPGLVLTDLMVGWLTSVDGNPL